MWAVLGSKRGVVARRVSSCSSRSFDEVFGRRDPVLRRDAIGRTYTDDIAFTDHAGTILGLAAVDD